MPRIPEAAIHCAFFLYRSRSDAETGSEPQGTGFIVQMSSKQHPMFGPRSYYAVSNWHVVCQQGASVIRLNTNDGGIDVVELDPAEWECMPGEDDVAVAPIDLDRKIHNVTTIHEGTFARQIDLEHDEIGVGEDVFMLGLFVDHSGHGTNVPAVRFGNISMLPDPKVTIEQPTGFHGESYVIDLHSRSGFSGSPVFAFRTFGSDLTDNVARKFTIEFDERRRNPIELNVDARVMFKFLGIHWGQFPERWELIKREKINKPREASLITEGAYVEGLSGMTCVIPSWRISRVLQLPKLRESRDKADADFETTRTAVPKPESAGGHDRGDDHR